MNIWPDTNPSLIEQAKCLHDPQAWEQLVSIYQPVLYRIAIPQLAGLRAKIPKMLSPLSLSQNGYR
jgi:hypothetical protein